MITIGQLARYAGVSVKTVRHYHRLGLLAEPSRDQSGYRRYAAEHAIKLVKIRTLAEAGVPLARVREVLSADDATFSGVITEIDVALARRVEELRRARGRLAELRGGDRLFVSERVAAFLERLQAIGVSQRMIEVERDIWVLMEASSPEQVDVWVTEKYELMSEPEFRAIYLEFDAAFDWDPDDPRLAGLAERMRQWQVDRTEPEPGEAEVVRFAIGTANLPSPAWDRLAELGATGPGSEA